MKKNGETLRMIKLDGSYHFEDLQKNHASHWSIVCLKKFQGGILQNDTPRKSGFLTSKNGKKIHPPFTFPTKFEEKNSSLHLFKWMVGLQAFPIGVSALFFEGKLLVYQRLMVSKVVPLEHTPSNLYQQGHTGIPFIVV